MANEQVWYATALFLPIWMVSPEGDDAKFTRVMIRKTIGSMQRRNLGYDRNNPHAFEIVSTGDRNDVLTPEGEEIVFVARNAGWVKNLDWQDVGRFGQYRTVGGPKYDKDKSLNLRVGELVVILPLGQLDAYIADPATAPEQPWGDDWKKFLREKENTKRLDVSHETPRLESILDDE